MIRNNLSDMMCLDIYLSGLSDLEYKKVQKHLKPSGRVIPPLLCWEFYYPAYQKRMREIEINADLRALHKYSNKFNWRIDLDKMLNAFPYDALILTDKTKNILWVNNGFTEMTGYPKSQAINRDPGFLQGEKTSKAVILKIRDKIQQTKPFKTEIINYRKDGSIYNCEIRFFPLIGENSLHFLALERVV